MKTPPEFDNERVLRLSGHAFQDSLLSERVLKFLVC